MAFVTLAALEIFLRVADFREFREGLAKLRDGEPETAVKLLRHAMDRDPDLRAGARHMAGSGLC